VADDGCCGSSGGGGGWCGDGGDEEPWCRSRSVAMLVVDQSLRALLSGDESVLKRASPDSTIPESDGTDCERLGFRLSRLRVLKSAAAAAATRAS
jgi:hypothetical protein